MATQDPTGPTTDGGERPAPLESPATPSAGRTLAVTAATGALTASGAAAWLGAGAARAAALGAATATANLWFFFQWGAAVVRPDGKTALWLALSFSKLLALFLFVYALFRHHVAEPLPFAVGYLALPLGIVLSHLVRRP